MTVEPPTATAVPAILDHPPPPVPHPRPGRHEDGSGQEEVTQQ
ncbi:hypothetical protein ACFY8B_23455 [Streptomyces sp. NPDC012751]